MTTDSAPLTCSECRRGIDCCCFCDKDSCQTAVCYSCLMIALRLAIPQPHAHGG